MIQAERHGPNGRRRREARSAKTSGPSGDGRGKKKGLVVSIVAGSLAVHAAALALFGLWKIAEYFQEPEATFTVERSLAIPAPTREHRMQMAQHRAMAPKPVFSERLVSIRPTAFALPDLPPMPIDQMIPLDPVELVADQLSSFSPGAGLGTRLGAGLRGSGEREAG